MNFLSLNHFLKKKEKKWKILVLTRGAFRLGEADPIADKWG